MSDNYTYLARCMGCEPHEVSGLIQQHAPWNGDSICESTRRERAAVSTLLRSVGLSLLAVAVERGEHLRLVEAVERGEHHREGGAVTDNPLAELVALVNARMPEDGPFRLDPAREVTFTCDWGSHYWTLSDGRTRHQWQHVKPDTRNPLRDPFILWTEDAPTALQRVLAVERRRSEEKKP